MDAILRDQTALLIKISNQLEKLLEIKRNRHTPSLHQYYDTHRDPGHTEAGRKRIEALRLAEVARTAQRAAARAERDLQTIE